MSEMKRYFQIKVTDDARAALDQESKNSLADYGWYEEDMVRWIVIDEGIAEDYFNLNADEILICTNHFSETGRLCKLVMCFDEIGESRESLLVEFNIREIPELVRQGNADKGFVVSDDIAFQMERELRYVANEAIPPGGGDACNWFQSELNRFFEGSN